MYDRAYYGYFGNAATACEPTGYCSWCSQPGLGNYVYHGGHCPKVKSIEYHPSGGIKRVEFHNESVPVGVKLAYVCDEWHEVKDDYPPLFYERVIDEVVKKLTDYSSLVGLVAEGDPAI